MVRSGKPSYSRKVPTLADFNTTTLPFMPKFEKSKINFTRAIESLARQMDTEFASHIVGRVELLAAAVLEHDENLTYWIDILERECKSHIELFWKLNMLLPTVK